MRDLDEDVFADDPELFAALAGERQRQEQFLELIASENYASPAVMAAQGSTLTNKYADGYPNKRTYSGCEFVDAAETLAVARAKRLFGAAYANVQPYSGTSANAAAYAALMRAGDKLLGMHAGHGGHITHGDPASFAGQLFEVVHYGVGDDGWIDYERAAALAHRHRPKVIVAGFSAYSRIVDWQRFRTIADEVGAYFVADMAHVSGLVAAGLYPNPVSIADVTTTTTHKTLRGPRGGMILARDESLATRLDAAVYPGQQGGPLMHVIAAKAVAFAEALLPEFAQYQQRVLDNARGLAESLAARGLKIVTGGTDNHMVLVDLAAQGLDGPTVERSLERAHIATNWIPLPSGGSHGLRLGTPAITTRGLGTAETAQLANWVVDILEAPESAAAIARVRDAVLELCETHRVYR